MMRNTLFKSPSARQIDIALLIIRAVTGVIFIHHGYQKLFVYGFSGVSGAFAHMGVPMPGLMGPFIGILELFGGIALIIGLLTRLVALGLACDMLGAIFLVLWSKGFGGFELEFLLCGGSLA